MKEILCQTADYTSGLLGSNWQIYDEARYNLSNLLRLHKIVQDLGLGGKEIIKVSELAKYDELQNLQWKVEYLRVDIKEYTGSVIVITRKRKRTRETIFAVIYRVRIRIESAVPYIQTK